jgi:DNA (cytosine-5)-methyltransferase 1
LLRACDYGAPTTRRRLFLVARCDGRAIRWPTPTHGHWPCRTGLPRECIDWSLPIPSIFDRDKPAGGQDLRPRCPRDRKFVIESREPYVLTDSAGRPFVPYLVHRSNGEREGQAPRIYDIRKPLGTIVAQGQKHALCVAYLAKHYGERSATEVMGSALDKPIGTVTTIDHHSLVVAFLTRYNGTSTGQSLDKPLSTIDTHDRFGLVTVTIDGQTYQIVDIGMRMLAARELFRAQGFAESYAIDIPGLSDTAKKRMCGNAVSPYPARELIAAQFSEAA